MASPTQREVFEQTPGDSAGQGSLAHNSQRGHNESDTTEWTTTGPQFQTQHSVAGSEMQDQESATLLFITCLLCDSANRGHQVRGGRMDLILPVWLLASCFCQCQASKARQPAGSVGQQPSPGSSGFLRTPLEAPIPVPPWFQWQRSFFQVSRFY